MKLKIILSFDNAPIAPALQALIQSPPDSPIELYCFYPDISQYNLEKDEIENINSNSKFPLKFFSSDDYDSTASLANSLFLNDDSQSYLFFLSSNIILEKDALKYMVECLRSDIDLAGVNPVLTIAREGWQDQRISFMGLAFDFQKKLHYLYEGILADNDLVKKERFFQIAHPGCLLIRAEDFRKAGGLKKDLDFLSFPALCLQILNDKPKGYACLSRARGGQLYIFDSWSYCGAWDSILQRGRLETSRVKADYPGFCLADGIDYSCDGWLAEGPAQIPDLSADNFVKPWQEWRYHPEPETLLKFLSSLPAEEKLSALELARNRPASLPQTLQYYKVQAEKIKTLLDASNHSLRDQIDVWQKRIRSFHYGKLKPGIELLKKSGVYNCSLDTCPAIFDAWVEVSENFEKLEISETWPEIAVVMPVWNPRPDFLRQAIESVTAQDYPKWELCVADDASTKSEIRPILESCAKSDKRVKLKFREENGHICRATNSALELARAPYTAFLDHDDLLSPHALGEVASLIAKRPDLGYIYTDDDRINEDNVRRTPFFKPDFDCDLFYIGGHLSTYKTSLIREVGGLRIGVEGSQDQDLRFRITERLEPGRIAHIPKILYHWRVHEESSAGSFLAKPYVLEASKKAYLDAAARQGRAADWGEKSLRGFSRLLYYPKKRYKCSVFLMVEDAGPSRNLLEIINNLEKFVDIEIYSQPLRKTSPRINSCLSLPYAGNGIASAYNEAAAKAAGDLALFLSADLEPEPDCRLEQLVELAMAPHVAMAGGNIWFGEKLVSGGWSPNADGYPFLLLHGMSRGEAKNSAWGELFLTRHVLGASWQCMAVKKEFYSKNKFMDEKYGALATVDFGLRAMEQNKFIAVNPWVNWQTRKIPPFPNESEMKFLHEQKGAEIAASGLRNPNLRAAPDQDWTIIFK